MVVPVLQGPVSLETLLLEASEVSLDLADILCQKSGKMVLFKCRFWCDMSA